MMDIYIYIYILLQNLEGLLFEMRVLDMFRLTRKDHIFVDVYTHKIYETDTLS